MLGAFLFGISATVLCVVIFGLWYYFAFIIRFLADRDILVTYPAETNAKAIMRNGRVHRFVMAFKGHCFSGDLDPMLSEPEKWDIVPGEVTVGSSLPFIKGMRWVGLPPFAEVYKYRFSWASLEEQSLNEELAKKPVFTEKEIDYIFLREDVYVTKMEAVECKDNMPLDAIILIGGKIVNPYKALFAVERWLEATINVVDSRMRSFFGSKTYAELLAIAESMHDEDEVTDGRVASVAPSGTSTNIVKDYFKEVENEVRDRWGFDISFIQIYSINPGSELAEKFIRASTLKYVAEQQRDANIAEGVGLASRDKSHFAAVAGIPGGAELFKWDSIRQSSLHTYVEGGGAGVSIPIGERGASGPSTEPRPNPADTEPAT